MYRREATIWYFLCRGFPPHEAEDLTQEVQVRLWLAQQQGVESNDLLWHRTCRSVLCDHLRRLRRERQLFVPLEEAIDSPAPSPEYDLPLCLDECLSVLSLEQQTIVRLHIEEGKTFAEIAFELRKTPCAVQKQYQRAINKLRKYLHLPDSGGGRMGYVGVEVSEGIFSWNGRRDVLFWLVRTSLIYGRTR